MTFNELADKRQSCRSYDSEKNVGDDVLKRIMETTNLAPSAVNAQPYHFHIVKGEKAQAVAKATQGMGQNKFATQAPVFIVMTEDARNFVSLVGEKIKRQDYRSVDIGIAASYISLAAEEEGLGSCILGWFDNKAIQQIIGTDRRVRLVISLGYPGEKNVPRKKKRKKLEDLVTGL